MGLLVEQEVQLLDGLLRADLRITPPHTSSRLPPLILEVSSLTLLTVVHAGCSFTKCMTRCVTELQAGRSSAVSTLPRPVASCQ
jgi:hypothetical protein